MEVHKYQTEFQQSGGWHSSDICHYPVTEMTEQLLKKALTVFTKTKHEITKARHDSVHSLL